MESASNLLRCVQQREVPVHALPVSLALMMHITHLRVSALGTTNVKDTNVRLNSAGGRHHVRSTGHSSYATLTVANNVTLFLKSYFWYAYTEREWQTSVTWYHCEKGSNVAPISVSRELLCCRIDPKGSTFELEQFFYFSAVVIFRIHTEPAIIRL